MPQIHCDNRFQLASHLSGRNLVHENDQPEQITPPPPPPPRLPPLPPLLPFGTSMCIQEDQGKTRFNMDGKLRAPSNLIPYLDQEHSCSIGMWASISSFPESQKNDEAPGDSLTAKSSISVGGCVAMLEGFQVFPSRPLDPSPLAQILNPQRFVLLS